MCGIIAAIDRSENALPVNNWIINQFEDQFARGTKGFGIINILPDKKIKVDRATEPVKFMLDLRMMESQAIIVHHRTPTSTDNKLKQTHPIMVDNGSLKYRYLMVHNGVISNDDEVKLSHEELGFCYNTNDDLKFNDSEALAIELARYIEGQSTELNIVGSMAFIILQISKKSNKTTKMFFGRKFNPLNMAKTRNKIYLSSEGKGDAIQEEMLYSCKLDEEMKLEKRKLLIKDVPITVYPAVASSTRTYYGYGSANQSHFDDDSDYWTKDKKTRDVYDDIDELDSDGLIIHEMIDDFFEKCWGGEMPDTDTEFWLEEIGKSIKEYKENAEKSLFATDGVGTHIQKRLDV